MLTRAGNTGRGRGACSAALAESASRLIAESRSDGVALLFNGMKGRPKPDLGREEQVATQGPAGNARPLFWVSIRPAGAPRSYLHYLQGAPVTGQVRHMGTGLAAKTGLQASPYMITD